MMSDTIRAIILGIIEGVTEFLPVSSTGHLLLAENTHLLPQQSELFNIVIQDGALLAVFLVFSTRIKELLTSFRQRESRDYLFKLTVAFGVTAVGGFLAKKAGLALPKDLWPITWATLVGGVLILLIEWSVRGRRLGTEVTWTIAVAVGLAQLLAAVFPGTSRSGATILVGLLFGLNRPAATDFSFLLGIPTLFAAGAYEIYAELRHPAAVPPSWSMLALATAVSAVVAFLVVRWMLHWVRTHSFAGFGWYRIALGLLMVALAIWGT